MNIHQWIITAFGVEKLSTNIVNQTHNPVLKVRIPNHADSSETATYRLRGKVMAHRFRLRTKSWNQPRIGKEME